MKRFILLVDTDPNNSILAEIAILCAFADIATLFHFLQILIQTIAKIQQLPGYNLLFEESFLRNSHPLLVFKLFKQSFFASALSFLLLVFFDFFFVQLIYLILQT